MFPRAQRSHRKTNDHHCRRRRSRTLQPRLNRSSQKIESGEIDLPNLDLESDDDYFAVWALMDSGASINAINAEKIVPNAVVQKTKQRSYSTANGGTISNMGQVTTVCRHEAGHQRTYAWQNVKVDMPILSTACMNDDTDDGSIE